MYGDNYSVGSTLPTLDGRFEFEWDGRMLTRARRLSDYTVIDYKYDADGNRTEKKVTNADGSVQKLTKYYYTDGVMTTEVNYLPNSGTLTADTKIDYIYDNTGLAFVMVEVYNSDNNYCVSTGKYTFYVKRNAQGDVTSLIDITSGNTGDSIDYIYTAYGRHYIEGISGDVSTMIADLNTVTYKGYSYDSDLEMYYLGSRWYDPEVCRFINGDSYVSTGQDITGFNMFAYCLNNPVNFKDTSGYYAEKAGGVVGGAIGLIDSILLSENKNNSNSLPKTGEPGYSQTLPNPDGTPKQKRWYGPDGEAVRDRDYNHSGDVPFPHDHEWKDGKRQKDHLPPSLDYEFTLDTIIGIGMVTICAIGMVAITADDLTGVGVADDFLYGPLGAGFGKGIIMIFG